MYIAYVILFLFGLAFGSFLNAFTWRAKTGRPIWGSHSECRYCHRGLKIRDNIPVLSFVLLGGKCRYCKHAISLQYPMVELLMGISFVFVLWFHIAHPSVDSSSLVLRDLYIVWVLIFIFVYDLLYMEVRDSIVIPAAVTIFMVSGIFGWQDWEVMLVGGIVGMSFFLVQYVASDGRWVGGGDVRIGLLMGVVLGWPLLLVGLFFAYVIGALLSLIFIASGYKKRTDKIPFGTYLTIGTIVAMFWGVEMLHWYLGIL